MPFGQIVIGPPGSGKTTYCYAMKQFLTGLGRDAAIVNLDPANDNLPDGCDLDIAELVTLDDIMGTLKLGPNGGLVYCLEYLEKNLDWLKGRLRDLKNKYVLFDFPGQVELYTHHNSVKHIVEQIQTWDFRLVSVHLVDSHHCSDAGKFISILLTTLNTMIHLELPHVNILSKIDLIEQYGKLAFNLDFYTEVLDLNILLSQLEEDPSTSQYGKLNKAIIGLIQDYSLVSFTTLNIQDKKSMMGVLKTVDKAIGYAFGDKEERNIQSLLSCAVGADFEYFRSATVQEEYMKEDND